MTNFSYIAHISILYVIRAICKLIPKKSNLILFSSWFGQKYADSSKYMFEYLLNNGPYCVKWCTCNKNLYAQLKKEKKPVVYTNSLTGIWNQIRAKMFISSIQLYDFNMFLLHNSVFFDLDHGFSLKQVGFAIPGADINLIKYQMAIRRGIDYWMSASTIFCKEKIQECYAIDSDHIVKCNKPRTDVLFDESLRRNKNDIVESIKNGRKAVVWMPTHRSCGEIKMPVEKLFNLDSIQKICEQHNFVFIIKKHFYHKNEKDDLSKYSNIYDLTGEDIDSQVILSQADALISDYSSSYIEYLVLDRPIILYTYDKDQFLANERDLYIKLEDNTAGEIVTTKEAFTNSIARISNDWYDTQYAEGRKKARDLYFDNTISGGDYRAFVSGIIDKLIVGKYTPNWKG